MREVRRIYRAQYLQKLAEVTEIERAKEEELHEKTLEERRRRKNAHLQRIGEDMKRRAILKDRKRIESKVNEAIEMARKSKLKRRQIFWYRRMENLSKLIATADNLEQALAAPPAEIDSRQKWARSKRVQDTSPLTSSGLFLSRNVSVPFLLRQLGVANTFPQRKTHRIPPVQNEYREVLEQSYDIMPEDEPRFDPLPPEGPSHEQRAAMLYGGFSHEEKLALLDQKIEMLKARLERKSEIENDPITSRLLDELDATRKAMTEADLAGPMKEAAKASRGTDPDGLPPLGGYRPIGGGGGSTGKGS